MNVIMRRSLWLPAAVASLAALSAVGQDADGSFDKTVSVDGAARLEVRTGSGAVTIRRGAAGEVHVVGRLRVWSRLFHSSADTQELVRRFESDPPVEVASGQVRVGYFDDDAFDHDHVSISYEIEVPADAEVMSHTGSGSQEITGVEGSAEAHTGSGSIRLRDLGGRVIARTGSGSIRADGIGGAFDGETGSGSITLAQAGSGDVRASTGSGSLELRGVNGALHAHSGSGRIEVDGRQQGAWDLETGSGSVRIALPADAAFDLDAHTGSGGIHLGRPVTIQGAVDEHRVSGRVGAGGPALRVRTGSGSVTID